VNGPLATAFTGQPAEWLCGIPRELAQFQVLSSDSSYASQGNSILTVSTGGPDSMLGAAIGPRIVFVSGQLVLVQSH
jgi:hypothetical protein